MADQQVPSHPMDRGWAWMVCLGAALQAYFVIGGTKSLGIIFMDLVTRFDAEPSTAAITLALIAGIFALFSVIANALGVMFSYRAVVLTGALIYVLSSFVTAFSPNIIMIIFFMGVPTGFAFAMMAAPSIVLVSQYFHRYKSFANGLALVGSSCGQMTLPYLTTYLLDTYGFMGAMLIFSALSLHAVMGAMLLRPPSFFARGGGRRAQNPQAGVKDAQTQNGPAANAVANHLAENDQVKAARSRLSLHLSSTSLNEPRPRLNKSLSDLAHSKLYATSNASMNLAVGHMDFGPSNVDLTEDVKEEGTAAADKPKPSFLRQIFDRDLLTSVTFIWFVFAIGFGHSGFIDSCLFIPSYAFDVFDDKYKGALILGVMGAADIGGRLGGGYFADLGLIERHDLVGISLCFTGSANILIASFPVMGTMMAYSILMGFCGGIYRALLPVIVIDLFGREKLSSGVGLGYGAMGLFILPMPSLIGYMRKVYGSYQPVYHMLGALMLLAGALFLSIRIAKKIESRRQAKRDAAALTRQADDDAEVKST